MDNYNPLLETVKDFLVKIIDSGYFIFERYIPIKTYRYAVCGGGNLVLETVLYYICFHLVLDKQNLDLGFIVVNSHIAALFFVDPIAVCVGFLLNRFIVFPDSNLPWKTQFLRYLLTGFLTLTISYISMKFLVEVLLFYPTPSRLFTIFITVLLSYIMQTTYSFAIQRIKAE